MINNSNIPYQLISKHTSDCISDLGVIIDYATLRDVSPSVISALRGSLSVLRSALYIVNIHRSDVKKDF